MPAVKFSYDFITSVVVGKDVGKTLTKQLLLSSVITIILPVIITQFLASVFINSNNFGPTLSMRSSKVLIQSGKQLHAQ